MLYWFVKKVLLGPALRVIFRPWVEGAENIPARGGAIFASNHLSFSDSIFLPLVVPRRMTFPAKMEYFTGTGVKGWLVKTFFKGMGQIPIDRSGGDASMAALRSGLRVLARGEFFGIYPEGTRSPDGKLYRGKTGVARMALEAGVPVVPVAMIDTDKAQPTGQAIPTIHRVGVRIGGPMDFSRYRGMEADRVVLRSITDEIMTELRTLSGQEYVDEYAATVKERIAARAKAVADDARVQVGHARAQAKVQVDQVREQAKTQVEQAKVQVDQVREQAKTQVEQAKEQVDQVREQAKTQVEQAKERFGSAAHTTEGPAERAADHTADQQADLPADR